MKARVARAHTAGGATTCSRELELAFSQDVTPFSATSSVLDDGRDACDEPGQPQRAAGRRLRLPVPLCAGFNQNARILSSLPHIVVVWRCGRGSYRGYSWRFIEWSGVPYRGARVPYWCVRFYIGFILVVVPDSTSDYT